MQKIDKTDTIETILTKGRFEVDYYQREYRWGRKQIEEMIMDFYDAFQRDYDPVNHTSPQAVEKYGYYYMGSIICTSDAPRQIVDGQQRLTSLTLLLIYLNRLQAELQTKPQVNIGDMICKDNYGTNSFNMDVPERKDCMQALLDGNKAYTSENESCQNLIARYEDIEDIFPDELKGPALPYFIYWLKGKVILLEIDTPSEDAAHTIFLTMNDRGLSLNSAEMLKAFIIQQVDECDRNEVNRIWQKNINQIKNAFETATSGSVRAEDVDFISAWMRAKYAKTIRETKKGAEDQDFELLGEKFHTWVRQNARTEMGLLQPKQYKELITIEMEQMTHLYLSIKKFSENMTKGYEAVFYNAHRNITYQNYLIMAAVRVDDTPDVVEKKIKLVSTFIDIFASTRIFNYKKVNWNTNKALLFRTMTQIRNADLKTIGIRLTAVLQRMNEKLDAIKDFELNQFTGRYMLHMLARITDYVDTRMGRASQFVAYIDRTSKSSYDIEHILPDDYPTYSAMFNDEEDFKNNRRKFGNLIILTLDHNRSYQDMTYCEKVTHYISDNILAQALNEGAYTNNPKFIALTSEFTFKAHMDKFDKEVIKERLQLYTELSKAIWNIDLLKEIAGGWDDAEAISVQSNNGRRFTVEYGDGRSWEDARKFGFVSASSNTTNLLNNINVGDFVFCHIAGVGFVGVGVCTAKAMPAADFIIEENDVQTPILGCQWVDESAKDALPDIELFVGVDWIYTVSADDGYWEKGMQSLPMVAYLPGDTTTHDKVLKHFNITIQ